MDSSGKEREAVQLMAEAEKRVKSSHSFLRGLFGPAIRKKLPSLCCVAAGREGEENKTLPLEPCPLVVSV
uniref:Uncharacterized protein n=1 Tax=Terrapene triunguis TaxID=2587831 RepID=A0A674JK52_9SAUR